MTLSSTTITNARRIAFGPQDKLMNMSKVKFQWAVDIHETMLSNFWTEKAVPMGGDKLCYRNVLSDVEQNAFDKALAFVSNLDGIQFNNLIHNIGSCITAPEVSGAIARQAAEEYLHVRAYQTMIEAISLDPELVYTAFERDGLLAAKNAHIMAQSDILKGEPTPANFARAVVGNIIMEGVYFYSAFLVFGSFAQNGKMLASADMIKYIARDEGGTHLELFSRIHSTFKMENPHLYDEAFKADARTMFIDAVAMEVQWGIHIIGPGFQGMTAAVMEGFVKTVANMRWEILYPGEVLYPEARDTAPWFFPFFKINGGRANFFETKPTDYSVSGLEW